MQVVLYKFTKRQNSTKEPAFNDPTKTVINDVNLKEETSFLFPTLIFTRNIKTGFNPIMFNYATIAVWQRYYFIKDWRWVNGVWECDLEVDVMASFKEEIGSTTAYIIRAASSSDPNIMDTFYPSKTNTLIRRYAVDTDIYGTLIADGCYVVGCINNETANRVGSTTYYALTNSQLASLLAYLFSGSIFNSSHIYDMSEGVYKALFDPFQYIKTCMWFPYPVSALGSTTANIKVGYWDTGVTGTICSTLIKEYRIVSQTALGNHPQIARGTYLNHAPFTRITAFISPFGEIPIDPAFMQFTTNWLYGRIYVDFITGLADLRLTITNGYDQTDPDFDMYKICTMRTSQVGVPIQISQLQTDYLNAISSGLGAVASGFMGNISGIFSGIGNAAASLFPKESSIGANGSFLELAEPPLVIVENEIVVDDNVTEFGRPLCKNAQISSLSGYVQTGEDDHAFSGTETECQMINKYMKSGFFYE